MRKRTTLYGVICQTEDKGEAHHLLIKTTDGEIIRCFAEEGVLDNMEKELLKPVSVIGVQHFDPNTGFTQRFDVEYFFPWRRQPISKAMEQAVQDFGVFFRDINPDEWTEEMREDE